MNIKDITLQHFAYGDSGANTVVNYAGGNVANDAGAFNTLTGNRINVEPTDGNGNYTGNLSAEMKTFYDKTLIVLAEANLVHDQFGQKRPIPKNGGKTIEFRKFSRLPKAMKPITEGVTPTGNKLKVSAITATVDQYGDYVEQTDMLELTAVDNTIVEATKELASQAGLTLDTVVRNELNGGTNVHFSKKNSGGSLTAITARSQMTKDCPLTVNDVYLASTELRSVNAPTIDGSYVAIIHPKMANALMTEAGEKWMDIQKYAQPGNILRGEIGKLGGVRFVTSTEAKIFAPAVISDGLSRLTVHETLGSSGTAVKVDEILTAGTYSGANKIKVYINGTVNYITAIANNTTYSTLTFGNSVSTTDGAIGNMICGYGGGKDGSAVFSTLFLAENAYGVTDIEGGGLEHIVKQRGYGNDPLNQRSSIGWKATKVAKRLIEEYLLRFESTSPEFSLITDAN